MAGRDSQVRMPLFDRLVDLDPGSRAEVRPARTYRRDDLVESICRDLERLLSTRLSVSASALDDRQRTVIDYGIPDFGTYSAANAGDRVRLATIVARTIEAFEPRLGRRVRAVFEPDPGGGETLRGRVDANLVVDEVSEPVSFLTVFGLDNVEVTALADE